MLKDTDFNYNTLYPALRQLDDEFINQHGKLYMTGSPRKYWARYSIGTIEVERSTDYNPSSKYEIEAYIIGPGFKLSELGKFSKKSCITTRNCYIEVLWGQQWVNQCHDDDVRLYVSRNPEILNVDYIGDVSDFLRCLAMERLRLP